MTTMLSCRALAVLSGIIVLAGLFAAGCTTTIPQQAPGEILPPPTQCSCPQLVFRDPEFAFELKRTLSAAYAGEADIGECLATASRIREGDFESWYTEWNRTADAMRQAGDRSRAAGHAVSAREAYYRAATYYRTAEFFLHGNPADPRITDAWGKGRAAFRDALALDTTPYEIIAIPYGNTTLPGYFYSPDTSGTPRPLLIIQTGFDGCQEELHPYAMAAVRRGYNVLTFEGPGQGAVIREQHIPFRPDWEAVVTPVVDYAVTRTDVDRDRIALWGISLGGYLAPRAAAYEPRIHAAISDGGVYDVAENLLSRLRASGSPAGNMTREELLAWLGTDPGEFNSMMQGAMAKDTGTRWLNENGMFIFNASSPARFWSRWAEMTLAGSAGKIRCPVLVTAGSADHFDPGAAQAHALYDNLAGERELIVFDDASGAGSHCQLGAFGQSFGTKFDWLDGKMA